MAKQIIIVVVIESDERARDNLTEQGHTLGVMAKRLYKPYIAVHGTVVKSQGECI